MSAEPKPQLTPTLPNPYDLLDSDDQLAVDLAVNSYPYIEIAKKFKVSRTTVKDWFCRSGRLNAAYKYMLAERNKEYRLKFKTIDKQIQEGAVDAIVTLKEVAKQKNMPGVVAAKDILDRAGFKPKDKVEVENVTPTKVEVHFNWPNDDNKPEDQH